MCGGPLSSYQNISLQLLLMNKTPFNSIHMNTLFEYN